MKKTVSPITILIVIVIVVSISIPRMLKIEYNKEGRPIKSFNLDGQSSEKTTNTPIFLAKKKSTMTASVEILVFLFNPLNKL